MKGSFKIFSGAVDVVLSSVLCSVLRSPVRLRVLGILLVLLVSLPAGAIETSSLGETGGGAIAGAPGSLSSTRKFSGSGGVTLIFFLGPDQRTRHYARQRQDDQHVPSS